MSKKSFEDMESLDRRLKESVRGRLGGRDPDDFIEDGMGGAVGAELLDMYSETQEIEMIGLLDSEIGAIESGAVDTDRKPLWE